MEQISTIGIDIAKTVFQVHGIDGSSKRLEAIPGVGPLIATALVASIPDPHVFRSGRDLSAWIGLVPKQNSTGGKNRLGSISKAGNRYLRQLLVVGALSVIRRAKQLGYTRHPWLVRLIASMRTERSLCERRCVVTRCQASSPIYHHAWSVWRPRTARIIGQESLITPVYTGVCAGAPNALGMYVRRWARWTRLSLGGDAVLSRYRTAAA